MFVPDSLAIWLRWTGLGVGVVLIGASVLPLRVFPTKVVRWWNRTAAGKRELSHATRAWEEGLLPFRNAIGEIADVVDRNYERLVRAPRPRDWRELALAAPWPQATRAPLRELHDRLMGENAPVGAQRMHRLALGLEQGQLIRPELRRQAVRFLEVLGDAIAHEADGIREFLSTGQMREQYAPFAVLLAYIEIAQAFRVSSVQPGNAQHGFWRLGEEWTGTYTISSARAASLRAGE